MKISILAVGKKMPAWVDTAWQEYAKRLPRELSPVLFEIALAQRSKNTSAEKAKQEEGQSLLTAINANSRVLALDVLGRSISTEQLAEKIQGWQMQGQDITILIGGPDGLAAECLQRADERWSLSAMTLPHPLVRIVLIEQLYRAWTIMAGHPYHK